MYVTKVSSRIRIESTQDDKTDFYNSNKYKALNNALTETAVKSLKNIIVPLSCQ